MLRVVEKREQTLEEGAEFLELANAIEAVSVSDHHF